MDDQTPSDVPVLEVEGLEHRIQDEDHGDIFILNVGMRIAVYPGSFVAILGDSGCGKTTLLSILGLLRRPYRPEAVCTFRIAGADRNGQIRVFDIADLWKRNQQGEIECLRRRHIGFALQTGDLLNALTVRENIGVPVRLNGASTTECKTRVEHLIREFGLIRKSDDSYNMGAADGAKKRKNKAIALADSRINTLSGGEYQRVVLARAIAHRPRIVFVDEPTSALNKKLARKSLNQLKCSVHEGNRTGAVVMITHDEPLADEFADTIIRMEPDVVPAEIGPKDVPPDRWAPVAAGRVVEIIERSNDRQKIGKDS